MRPQSHVDAHEHCERMTLRLNQQSMLLSFDAALTLFQCSSHGVATTTHIACTPPTYGLHVDISRIVPLRRGSRLTAGGEGSRLHTQSAASLRVGDDWTCPFLADRLFSAALHAADPSADPSNDTSGDCMRRVPARPPGLTVWAEEVFGEGSAAHQVPASTVTQRNANARPCSA